MLRPECSRMPCGSSHKHHHRVSSTVCVRMQATKHRPPAPPPWRWRQESISLSSNTLMPPEAATPRRCWSSSTRTPCATTRRASATTQPGHVTTTAPPATAPSSTARAASRRASRSAASAPGRPLLHPRARRRHRAHLCRALRSRTHRRRRRLPRQTSHPRFNPYADGACCRWRTEPAYLSQETIRKHWPTPWQRAQMRS